MTDYSKKITNPYYLAQFVIGGVPEEYQEYKYHPEYVALKKSLKKRIRDRKEEDNLIQEALLLYAQRAKRVIVSSFMLAGSTIDEIATCLVIDKKILEVYAKYFFKMETLQSPLDRLAFATTAREDERESYVNAIKHGKDFLKWYVCGVPITGQDNLKKSLSELFTLSKYKASISAGSAITKDDSKESLKWILGANKIAQTLAKLEKDEAEFNKLKRESDEASNKMLQALISLKEENTVKNISDINDDETV